MTNSITNAKQREWFKRLQTITQQNALTLILTNGACVCDCGSNAWTCINDTDTDMSEFECATCQSCITLFNNEIQSTIPAAMFMNSVSGDVQSQNDWLCDYMNQSDVTDLDEWFSGLIEVTKNENGEWTEV